MASDQQGIEKSQIKLPRYTKKNISDTDVHSLSIDSTGLKRFGRDEWHQEKHKVSAKRSWRKLHIAVDQSHYIHNSLLTDRFESDTASLPDLLDGINGEFNHISMDGAYDSFDVYEQMLDNFGDVEIAIPPDRNAVICDTNRMVRNHNIEHIISASVLNKMTSLGMPNSYRIT